jgi:fused signal recognition particle receptor
VDVYLTLDAAMGQNALEQAAIFQEWVRPTGIILTKLDGSAKGGVAVALVQRFQIPIKYIGVGEGIDDLVPFDARAYADSLLPDKNRHS